MRECYPVPLVRQQFFEFSGLNPPVGEEGLRTVAHDIWGDAEGVGFFRLEKRKQRAGGIIIYGPGVETSLQKDAQWKEKKQ